METRRFVRGQSMSWDDCVAALQAGVDPVELMPRVRRAAQSQKAQTAVGNVEEDDEETKIWRERWLQRVGDGDESVAVPLEIVPPPLVFWDGVEDVERAMPLDGELEFDLMSAFKLRFVEPCGDMEDSPPPPTKRQRSESIGDDDDVESVSDMEIEQLDEGLKVAVSQNTLLPASLRDIVSRMTRSDWCVLLGLLKNWSTEVWEFRRILQLCQSRDLADLALTDVLPALVTQAEIESGCWDSHEEFMSTSLRNLVRTLYAQSSLSTVRAVDFIDAVKRLGLSSLGLTGLLCEVEFNLQR